MATYDTACEFEASPETPLCCFSGPSAWLTLRLSGACQGPPGAALPGIYIACTQPMLPTLEFARARARRYRWPIRELAAGHDVVITQPDALAALILHEEPGQVRSEAPCPERC